MSLFRSLANSLVMTYGAHLPHHRGKWRVLKALIDGLKLEKVYKGNIYTVRRGGLNWKLNPECLVHRTILYEATYEPRESRWLESVVRPGWTVLDVGANCGYFSMLIEKLASGTADIHAFEPLGENFEYLNENRRLNSFDRIKTYQMAVGQEEGELTFVVPPRGNMGQGRVLAEGEDAGGLEVEKVRVITLDAFVAEKKIERVDFIKMDVEGAEPMVIAGARATIERDKPIMMIEINPESLAEFHTTADALIDTIASLGYDLFTVEPGRLLPLHDAARIDPWRNAICLPKNRSTSQTKLPTS